MWPVPSGELNNYPLEGVNIKMGIDKALRQAYAFPMTITVWRVEHNCPDSHGPLQPCLHVPMFSANSPSYGSCLETPGSDPLLRNFYSRDPRAKECIYGTLPEQFARWWSVNWDTGKPYVGLPQDWYAVCFEVNDHACWVGTNQVMFLRTYAMEISRTRDRRKFPR